ncbi:radical SAM domain iron-sulfur cluster-binding oxidoreductase [Syntrophotalea carbinolica DSM 2380]|uniref:Radical SAM domain iron-sulfur cluster-binding oxidoreductase n=1 Tax=Syntrophotalea carbinolica (strain DSM 2380 / NBRC 103641 / GraBd1) TaxID=338963 RepID=Q3A2H3_SYNC1|nr:radical SAM protein [Syntrophotalea carbinolica]ABA89434.1 radical SAM domain iron-sulfur cluster-binding oxidoreductase [Syntrophotalea carbinolica DSM 2380]
MSRKLMDKRQRRLAAESGLRSHAWGGRLSVALVYPNVYHQAMSNLGFQTVYELLNRREDTLCERFFLPDADDLEEHRKTGYPLFSLETGRFLEDFDIIAVSISFENDYLNLPVLFELAHMPLMAGDRKDAYPLVLCGGVCAFLNPEPLAEIMDLFAIGEAEPILPGLVEALVTAPPDRDAALKMLATLPGVYVPSLYRVRYTDSGTVASYEPQPEAPEKVARQWVRRLDGTASRSCVLTDDTEFGDMALVEISRGCARKCRFCAAGYIYLPPRERSAAALQDALADGLAQRQRVGLVSPAVADHSQIGLIGQQILQAGGQISVASLRIDSLTAQEVESMAASGHRTVAIAPEAGSQRLRDFINKGLDEQQILAATQLIADGGIPNLKLYFLIGLPTETPEDMEELLTLAGKIRQVWLEAGRKRGRLGNLTLSVNPFIPKPFTPLQWAAMESTSILKKKIQRLRRQVGRMPNTSLICESLKSAELQALLSRGDRRVGRLLPHLADGQSLAVSCREESLGSDFYLTRERDEYETFPWEIIDQGVPRRFLWLEYQRAMAGESTPPCGPGCHRCGLC